MIALLGEEQLLSYSFFLAGAGYLLAPLSESVPKSHRSVRVSAS